MNTTLTKTGILAAGILMVSGTAFAAIPQEAKEALSNNDYSAFVTAVEGTRAENITEERFEHMVERHEVREERREAVDSENYTAFSVTFTDEKPAPSEDTFELLIELHEAHEAEDEDAIKEIRDELRETGEWKGKKHRGDKGPKGERGERPERN